MYATKQIGAKYTTSFKTYVMHGDKVVSPFHDIPLFSGEYVNVVNEIPRFEHAKFEISKAEPFNPITQDIKKGKVRFVKNIFPSYGYQFNYGAFPQTWEDPTAVDKHCAAKGDNDPLDALEIGSRRKGIGEVYQARILGALGLLDDGEADWKILVIDVRDEMADKVRDIGDVKKHFPGLLGNTLRWFRDYKVPDGKSANKFALEGEFMDAEFAKSITKEAHESWKRLLKKGFDEISLKNSTLSDTEEHDAAFAVEGTSEPDAVLPEDIHAFSYVSE